MDDLIDGLVRLMNSPDDFTGPVNLGNPDEFTILLLAQKIGYGLALVAVSALAYLPFAQRTLMQSIAPGTSGHGFSHAEKG